MNGETETTKSKRQRKFFFLERKSKYTGEKERFQRLAVCGSPDLMDGVEAKMDVPHSSCRDFSDSL
jgi:hypothetical protein